jgi:hypothetical protein
MAAGDLVYSLDVISIDAENVVTLRTTTSVVAKDGSRQGVRPNSIVFTPTEQQLTRINELRAAILATLATTSPDVLKGQLNVTAPTRADRRAEADARRDTARKEVEARKKASEDRLKAEAEARRNPPTP